MAKLLYNVSAYENTATKWATDTRIYPANSLLIESDTGILKKGDGVKTYANLATIGAKQDLAWADVTGKPSTFAPSAHTHSAGDITSGAFAITRIPTGTTASTVALGNHTHAYNSLTGIPSTFAPSAHTHLWADITDKPSTFAPEIGTTATKAAAGNHNHAVVVDAESGLEAASDIQALAIALSTRIKALEDLSST
jgi:hypothetical protein